jgi:hypothetical protein
MPGNLKENLIMTIKITSERFSSAILALFLFCFTQRTLAQSYVDVIKLNYNNTSQNSFENSNAKTRVEEFDLETTLPIVLNARTNFLTGFIYEHIQTKLFEDGAIEKFSSFSLKIGINKTHSAKWSGTYVLIPRIASDFNQISKKDFQLGGYGLLKYTRNENVSYKLGLYANSELSGPWFVPLFGLYYLSPGKKLEVNLTVPILADVNYALHSKIAIGFNYSGQIRSYHLTKISSTEKNGYVTRATNDVSGYFKFSVSKSIIVQTKVGRSVGRYYRVYEENDKVTVGFPLLNIGDNRTQLNTDFEDGWTYQAMLIYRFKRDS